MCEEVRARPCDVGQQQRTARALLSLTVAALTIFSAPRAVRAEGSSNAERAEALFDEGRALMRTNQFREACAKFAESEALDPGGGTILNLGICRRREGLGATAFKLLTEALNRARTDGRNDRIATAEKNLAELGPELSRLTVRLTTQSVPEGLTLKLDSEPFALSQLGQAIALDPGVHRLQASRPGYAPWSAEVSIDPVADAKALTVPELVSNTPVPTLPVAKTGSPPLVSQAPSVVSKPQKAEQRAPNWAGVGLVSVGGVALTAGTYFGLHAFTLRSRSDKNFANGYCTAQSCHDDWESAKTSALLSDIGLGVGIVALAVGGYVLLRSAPSTAASAAPTLSVAASGSDLRAVLKGKF